MHGADDKVIPTEPVQFANSFIPNVNQARQNTNIP